ncbi:Rio2, N-terminal-domain-containing protein [Bombardia bombarda]|uniref:Serine/threonine-protein kinase RIO2 n=1 Tax=Bombardia bombarda TaxID=252184 RepID=A0AA39X9E4_9PEZI|nr:Rio2, N-terminal-domain-containing protein [Bombardia bombarda]
MKLDTRVMRYLTGEDWRVLTAVEMGSKNHENVPTPLIEKLSRLKGGASGVHKSISALAKAGLIAKLKDAKYDGYRLTYGGLDYLALHTHSARKEVYSVGSRVGVGKESDIVIVADETGTQRILKIHRLGRISFRTVKSNRDYLKNRAGGSWMYLSRLAAMKEYAFMVALKEEGFPVPDPISQSRHTIVMSLVDAPPLRQIYNVQEPASLYAELIALILRLARHGLIHGDFNEFNILIKEDKVTTYPTTATATITRPDADDAAETSSTTPSKTSQIPTSDDNDSQQQPQTDIILTPVLIDFPQMVSMDHQNAEFYFDRDVACIKRFFQKRFHFTATQPGPFYKDAKRSVGRDGFKRLDASVEASGFTKKMAKDLEKAILEQQQAAAAKKADKGDFGDDAESDLDAQSDDEEDDDGDDDDDENDDGEDQELQEEQNLADIPTFNGTMESIEDLKISPGT